MKGIERDEDFRLQNYNCIIHLFILSLTVYSYQLSVWLPDQQTYTQDDEYNLVLLNISSYIFKDNVEKGMEITTKHCIFQYSKLWWAAVSPSHIGYDAAPS